MTGISGPESRDDAHRAAGNAYSAKLAIRMTNRGGLTGETAAHPSETELTDADFEFCVDNGGTADSLRQELRGILETKGLI